MVPPDESHFAVGTVGIVLVVGVLCLCTVTFSVCHMSFFLVLLVLVHR